MVFDLSCLLTFSIIYSIISSAKGLLEMKCLLIVNPRSGKMKIQNELIHVIKLLNENGYEVTVEVTRYHNHARELVAKLRYVYDLIICSGGDGTLNQVVSGLVDSGKRTSIGYIPSGSTNDYANTLGLSSNILEATTNIINGKPYLLDVGKLDNNYFNYIASFGLFSSVSYSTPQTQKNIFGHIAYILNGLNDLANIKTYHIKGTTTTKEFEGDYLLGLVMNTTSIAGLFKLDPELVNLSDGLFEILLIKKPKDMIDRGNLVEGLINRDFSNPAFTFLKADSIHFSLDNETSWSLDGEEVKLGKEVDISILHQRLSLIF